MLLPWVVRYHRFYDKMGACFSPPRRPFLKSYLWDVDFLSVDRVTHSQLIIERLLEEAIAWLFELVEMGLTRDPDVS